MTSTWFFDTGQLHVGTNIYSKMRNIVISNFFRGEGVFVLVDAESEALGTLKTQIDILQ